MPAPRDIPVSGDIRPAALRAHLEERLLPLWDRFGWDATDGGFHSRLGLDLRPIPDGFKRLTVQMRQLYVYSLAAAGDPAWAARAQETFRHVRAHFWDAKSGGWFLTTSPAGDPLDRSKDTYAHAFAILGLVHYHGLEPRDGALDLAIQSLDLLRRHLWDREHGGFLEAADPDWAPQLRVRRHDPHMHLFEAALAACELGHQTPFASLASELLDLFDSRLFPPPHRALAETYAADWTPAPGTHVEPGHHFEWFWLLERACAHGLCELPGERREALFGFAARQGVDPSDGGVFDRLTPSGEPLDTNKRVWPQTEYQKALSVRLGIDPTEAVSPQVEAPTPRASSPIGKNAPRADEPGAQLQRSLRLCFDRYVDPSHGGWNEHADRSGRIHSQAMNATTVYHVYVALTEVARRLEDALARSTAGDEPSR